MPVEDKASFWLDRAATALDCALQLTGDEYSPVIAELERRCDDIAKIQREKGN